VGLFSSRVQSEHQKTKSLGVAMRAGKGRGRGTGGGLQDIPSVQPIFRRDLLLGPVGNFPFKNSISQGSSIIN